MQRGAPRPEANPRVVRRPDPGTDTLASFSVGGSYTGTYVVRFEVPGYVPETRVVFLDIDSCYGVGRAAELDVRLRRL